jgi:hypothetical protein
MAHDVSLSQASIQYDKDSEHQFRRELELILLSIASSLEAIAGGQDSNNSLYLKRSSYRPPIGVVAI